MTDDVHTVRVRPATREKREQILKAAVEIFGNKGSTNGTLADVAGKQRTADPRLDVMGEVAPQRPCSVERVIASFSDQAAGLRGELERDLALGETVSQVGDEKFDDRLDLINS